MSKEKTSFETIPNEILFCIFDFLTTSHILKAFGQLNYRFRDIIQCHVKHIDLTDDLQIYQSELEHIYQSIESAKVNKRSLSLFMSYEFPRLHSLYLINIIDVHKILTRMRLTLINLKIWFHGDTHSSLNDRILNCGRNYRSLFPLTLKRFSSNGLFLEECLHENITHLNVYIGGISLLMEMIEQTPNIQHISAHFMKNFDTYGKYTDAHHEEFKNLTTQFQRLSHLNSIRLTTVNDLVEFTCNPCFPFYQVQLFIDNCCPDKTILKKITLEFHGIRFNENMWSTIQRYKNTFDSFNVYIPIGLGLQDRLEEIKNQVLLNNQFAFHIEYPFHKKKIDHPTIFIYTLPLNFKQFTNK